MSFARKPKLVAFDLDGTIWHPEMYQLWGGAPFTAVGDGTKELVDSSGSKIRLLGATGTILKLLKTSDEWDGVKTAWVSCTDEPVWARECLEKFKTDDGIPIGSYIDSNQIFKDNKQSHFRNLKALFPDIEYDEMIFFDNEMGNIRTVSKLGVHCIYCPDGVTKEIWDEGLENFASR